MAYTASPYEGAKFLYEGISGLGEDFAKAMDEHKKQQQLDAYNDAVVNQGYKSGDVSLDDLTKYNQMSGTQKTGFAAGLAANMHDKMKDALQQSEIDLRNQQIQRYKAETSQFGQPIYADNGTAAPSLPIASQAQPPLAAAQNPSQSDVMAGLQPPTPGTKIGVMGYGQPHYFPYGGRATMPQFTPPPEQISQMKDAGYIWAQTSRNAGHYHSTKGGPDLDANGDPIYTPDGMGYLSGGQVKLFTPAQKSSFDEAHSKPTPAPVSQAKDQQALAWARANPNDPRAKLILARLGVAQ